MAKIDELTVEVTAKLTISDETAKRCMDLLELWLDDNPDKNLVSYNGITRHELRIERLGQEV